MGLETFIPLSQYKEKIPNGKPLVGIVMASINDNWVMEEAAYALEYLHVPYCADAISAHRDPERVEEYANAVNELGSFYALIVGAGMSASLPGALAALIPWIPIIFTPIVRERYEAMDAFLSAYQMVKNIPVGVVAVNDASSAGFLAAQMIATHNPEVKQRLFDFRASMVEKGRIISERLHTLGPIEYHRQMMSYVGRL